MFQDLPHPAVSSHALCQLRQCPGLSLMLDLGAFDARSIPSEQEKIVKAAREMLDVPSQGMPAAGFISAGLAGVISDDIEEGPLEDWHVVVGALGGDSPFERSESVKALRAEFRVATPDESLFLSSSPQEILKAARESWVERNRNMPERAMFWGFISDNLIREEGHHLPLKLCVASRVSPEFEPGNE